MTSVIKVDMCMHTTPIPHLGLIFFFVMEVVVHDGVIREKPTTPEEARKFIQGLSYHSSMSSNYLDGLLDLFV